MIPLTPLRSLAPVSAASGLARVGDRWCIVADDALALAAFPVEDLAAPPALLPLFDGALPAEPRARKRAKPDLESLAALPAFGEHAHGALLALGSGSRPNRMRGALLALGAGPSLPPPGAAAALPVREIDLSALYAALAARLGELNIEGAAVAGDALVLLQRGHRGGAANAVVRLSLAAALAGLARGAIGEDAIERIVPVALGAMGDVPLGFTDASALPDGRLVFTAAAEDTVDAYEDGGVAGSAIGILDASGAVLRLDAATPPVKLEGVAAVPGADGIRLALASDADDPATPSVLYAATLPA